MAGTSVQRAHDELVASGASHPADCAICQQGTGVVEGTKEVARVAGEAKYTEDQHLSLVAAAVERETSSLTTAKTQLETEKAEALAKVTTLESEKADLQTKLDLLEAEKAAAESARDAAVKEFEDFKTELQKAEELAQLRTDRVKALKEAGPHLPAEYFDNEERQTRWAQMAQESFDALVEGLTESAKGAKPAEGGDTTTTTASDKDRRETAAFTGGDKPTGDTGGSSTLAGLFQATGRLPQAAN